MFYKFPHITHINEVLEAIKGREEFVVKHDEDGGYKVINYLVNFEDTFPPVTDRRTAILRECRGITFDAVTGKVVSRKYHKFFNLNERAETRMENIDWTLPHNRLEKLDGSMITPLLVNGKVRWCTKMGTTGVSAPVDEFVSNNPHYEAFALRWMNRGYTPIFEWCSRQQRIVIDYPEERLVLTNIRNNESGEYLYRVDLEETGEEFGIPVVKIIPFTNMADLLKEAEELEGEEGWVIQFRNGPQHGHMLKVKGAWYCQLHKTLEHLRFEKDVIRLIVDERIDDAKAFLPVDLVSAVDGFAKQIFTNITDLSTKLFWEAQAAHDNLNGSKKKFAESIQGSPHTKFLFQAWDHLDEGEAYVRGVILQHVKNNLSTQNKVDTLRGIIGSKTWKDYHRTDEE